MIQEKKELIISLIEDDLKNTRLVSGLQKLGLDSSNYYLNLSQTVFKLIGFKDNAEENEVQEVYIKFSEEEVLSIDINKHPEQLTDLASKIFDSLIEVRRFKKKRKLRGSI